MKLSHTLGITALASAVAASGFASALTIYGADGYIVSSTCPAVLGPSVAATLGQGVHSTGQLYLQASGITGSAVESAGTPPTASATGSTTTYSCIDNDGAPARGLAPVTTYTIVNKMRVPVVTPATLVFVCYTDTQAGPAAAPSYVLTQKFSSFAPNNSPVPTRATSFTTEVVSTLLNGITPVCSWTTDGTYVVQ
jgi:hypothetical protein